jgi:SAM-dependent methyltransferase
VEDLYSREFYSDLDAGSAVSADVIVPILLSVFPASSVIDIGCGTGTWLQAFARNGVTDYIGIDGMYVPPDLLKIPADRFRAADLQRLLDVGRRFDIACSLEVAEHLPSDCAKQFVELLTKAAPVVLFSAAVPHQGGTGHINEQWQSYWSDLFSACGYSALDCIRPAVYGDKRVEWWYRQNTLVYCDSEHRPAQCAPVAHPIRLNYVDSEMIEMLAWRAERAEHPSGIRMTARAIRRDVIALGRSLGRKVVRGWGSHMKGAG